MTEDDAQGQPSEAVDDCTDLPTDNPNEEVPEVYTPASDDRKARIRLHPGFNHIAIDGAEHALGRIGPYYDVGGPVGCVVERPGGGLSVQHVNEHTLKAVLGENVVWEKNSSLGWARCDPPNEVVVPLCRRQGRTHLKPLSGIAHQPYFRADGTLVRTAGYDPETHTLAVFQDSEFEFGPFTEEGAREALAYLRHLLSEFPFASSADEAAALSAILTAAARQSLPLAPAISISATRSGSGKSYYGDMVALVAGPGEAAKPSYATTAEEASKLVVSVLVEKPTVVIFDDMQTGWKSFGAINKALTSEFVTERLLGSSRTVTASTKTLFLGTGNNIEPERDMRRRVMTIRMEPRHGAPAFRRFKHNPLEEIRHHRSRAVACALTIIAAYLEVGSLQEPLRPIGSYGRWSEMCREPLVWLGEPDPATSLIQQVTEDPDEEALAHFQEVWFKHFGTASMTVRKVLEKASHLDDFQEALDDLPVWDGRNISPNRMGWYLRNVRGRRIDGLRFELGDSSERRSWRILPDSA